MQPLYPVQVREGGGGRGRRERVYVELWLLRHRVIDLEQHQYMYQVLNDVMCTIIYYRLRLNKLVIANLHTHTHTWWSLNNFIDRVKHTHTHTHSHRCVRRGCGGGGWLREGLAVVVCH